MSEEKKSPTSLQDGVMVSAFVVWVNHKCIVVVAKTKEEVMDRLRGAGVEWTSIKIEPLDAVFPHLP